MKNKLRILPGLLGLLLILLTVYSCGGTSTVENGTKTPRPSPAESVKMTLTANGLNSGHNPSAETTAIPPSSCALPLPGDQGWTVRLCDNFNDNSSGWTVESQDNPYAKYSIDVKNGAYSLDYTAKSFAGYQRYALTWFDVASAQDFALSVTGRINSDFQNCSWGVAFRADDDSFFLFSIYNDNSYIFEIYENNRWIPLITRRAYDKMKAGQANKLDIIAEGGDFTFYINDNLVNSFNGGLLQDDGIKLVTSAKEGVSASYTFDDVVLQVKP